MPRVSTFLKNVLSYHTTYPTEKEAKLAKRQPKVNTLPYLKSSKEDTNNSGVTDPYTTLTLIYHCIKY